MSHSPLKVLIVSADRGLLRALSRLLGALGHQVEAAAGEAQARAALDGPLPPLVVFDASGHPQQTLALCRELSAHPQRDRSVVLLVDRLRSAEEVRRALEAGADDVLAAPVVYCELLSRIRVAARTFQWLQRADAQQRPDPHGGLANRAAFVHDLWKSGTPQPGAKQAACVLLQLDGFARVDREHGRRAAVRLAHDFGVWLAARCGDGAAPAALEGGRFAVWRTGAQVAAVDDWCAEIRCELAVEEFQVAGQAVRLSASIGVAMCASPEEDAAGALAHAEEAMLLAVQSGQDHAARYEEVLAQDQAWAELADQGKLLEGGTARDVMIPCAMVLQSDQPAGDLAAILGHGEAVLPVVDAKGQLVGLAGEEQMAGVAVDDPATTVAEVMLPDPACRDERCSLAELMKAFAEEEIERIVITHRGRPLGIVTLESFLAIAHPAEGDAPAEPPFSRAAHYLFVPETAVK